MSEKFDMPDRWYSTKEICAYLGISRDTMLIWIAKKNISCSKMRFVTPAIIIKLSLYFYLWI